MRCKHATRSLASAAAAHMGGLLSLQPPREPPLSSVDAVAELIAKAHSVVVLSGAGVSRESGIPTFRDPADGLWRRFDPLVYATIWGFDRQPAKIWELLRAVLADSNPQPNAGHAALAQLEQAGCVSCLVTQNVDGLHQAAGQLRVIEYHGSLLTASCRTCRAPGGGAARLLASCAELPPRCACGGPLKPDAILFGEAIPAAAAQEAAGAVAAASVLLVVGTSATVKPAADLPRLAARAGAHIVEVNTEPTGLTGRLTTHFLKGKAGEVLPLVARRVMELRRATAVASD